MNSSRALALDIRGAQLIPSAFSEDVTDYALYCSKTSGNKLTFDLTSVPGSTSVSIKGMPVKQGEKKEVVANSNDLIELTSKSGTNKRSFWFRCLPPNFPRVEVKSYGTTSPGWYLMSTVGEKGQDRPNYSMVLDVNAVPVWYRSAPISEDPNRDNYAEVNFQAIGDGSVTSFTMRPFPFGIIKENAFLKTDLYSKVLGKYKISGNRTTNHHELFELPDGGFLLTSSPLQKPKAPKECFAPSATRVGYLDIVKADLIASARIERLDASGKTIWSWDADIQGYEGKPDDKRIDISENTESLCWKDAEGRYLLSAVHPNAVDLRGNLLVLSARNMDAVYGIDIKTGNVVFKLGGTPREGVSLQYIGKPNGAPMRQHDVRLLPNGRMTLFNNNAPGAAYIVAGGENDFAANFSEYQLDLQKRTATLIKSFDHPEGLKSSAMGSARVQPDGSVLVGWGSTTGRLAATEFSPDGKRLIEFRMPELLYSYRFLKVERQRFNIEDLRKSAGKSL